MKIRVVELPRYGASNRGRAVSKKAKTGFYLVYGKEVLSGPHKSAQNCYEARLEWVTPGAPLTS